MAQYSRDLDNLTITNKRYQNKLLRKADVLGMNKEVKEFLDSLVQEDSPPLVEATYLDEFLNVLTLDLSFHTPDTDTDASAYTVAGAPFVGELQVIGTAGYATAPASDGSLYGNIKTLIGKTLTAGGSMPGVIYIPSDGVSVFKSINMALIDSGSFNGLFVTLDYDNNSDFVEIELNKLTTGIPSNLDTLQVSPAVSLDGEIDVSLDFDGTDFTFTVEGVGSVTGAHGFGGSTNLDTFQFGGKADGGSPIRFMKFGEW